MIVRCGKWLTVLESDRQVWKLLNKCEKWLTGMGSGKQVWKVADMYGNQKIGEK